MKKLFPWRENAHIKIERNNILCVRSFFSMDDLEINIMKFYRE